MKEYLKGITMEWTSRCLFCLLIGIISIMPLLASLLVVVFYVPPRQTHLVGWDPPMIGWVKVNTDGARKGNSSMADWGGVVRDHLGSWVRGFMFNVGFGTFV